MFVHCLDVNDGFRVHNLKQLQNEKFAYYFGIIMPKAKT